MIALAMTPEERSQRTALLATSGCRVRRADVGDGSLGTPVA
jgi:hypothetical protein